MTRTMKLFAAGVLLTALAFSSVNAQPHHPGRHKSQTMNMTPEQKASHVTDKMAKELNLTEKQKKEVYKIQLNDIKAREKQVKKDIAQRDKTRQSIRKVLTADQLKAFESRKKHKHTGAQTYKGQRSSFKKATGKYQPKEARSFHSRTGK